MHSRFCGQTLVCGNYYAELDVSAMNSQYTLEEHWRSLSNDAIVKQIAEADEEEAGGATQPGR